MQGLMHLQVKLLEGEEEAERLGNERNSLILTNKRIIHFYRDGLTSKAAVAFLQDIDTARVRRARPNKIYLAIAVVLALAAFVWCLSTGFGGSLGAASTAVILIADLVLILACLALYLSSSGAVVVFRTANDEIAFRLGAGDSFYRFINRWLELKDSASRGTD